MTYGISKTEPALSSLSQPIASITGYTHGLRTRLQKHPYLDEFRTCQSLLPLLDASIALLETNPARTYDVLSYLMGKSSIVPREFEKCRSIPRHMREISLRDCLKSNWYGISHEPPAKSLAKLRHLRDQLVGAPVSPSKVFLGKWSEEQRYVLNLWIGRGSDWHENLDVTTSSARKRAAQYQIPQSHHLFHSPLEACRSTQLIWHCRWPAYAPFPRRSLANVACPARGF